MTAFTYRAVDASGNILSGELAANSEAELDTRLLQIGLQLVTCNALSKRQIAAVGRNCLLYTSPSPRDRTRSRMPSSA